MAPGGITRRTLAPQRGTAGLIPTVLAQGSVTAATQAGVSASATGMATIPGITRGGDPWVITVAAGIPTSDGVRGAARRSPMCTASGAIRPIPEREQHGQIRTPETMVRRPAVPITTPRLAGAQSRDEDTT